MAVKEYKYNSTIQLSPYFNVKEFKCKCGGNHNIKVDSDLIDLLGKVRGKLNAKSCNIYSGYRCPKHDKKVGGSGSGPHTQGYAVDCYFVGKDGNKILSSKVALCLEDLGHKYGIGYRCGGGSDKSGQIHIDTKKRKWYGDESKSMSKSCCTSFYNYFGIKKEVTNWTPGKYKLLVSKAIRTSHTLTDNIVKVGKCMDSVKLNLTSSKANDEAKYKVGTIVDITNVYIDKTNRIWGQLKNCWIVLCNKDGSPQAKKL